MKRLKGIAREVVAHDCDWLFQEGREASEFFVLREGAVELLTSVNGHFELPITLLRSPGDCFGSSAIVAPHTYSLSARSKGTSSLLAIDRQRLLQLFQEDWAFGYVVMTNVAQHLLDRLRETRQELKTHFKSLFQSAH
jgi:CRP-like cAMP-binding protein